MVETANSPRFRFSENGLLSCSPEEHIQLCLRASLLTQRGELPSQPQLGSRLIDSIFRPLTNRLKQDLVREIRSVVQDSEPRISLETVEITPDREQKTAFQILLRYRIKKTNKSDQARISLIGKGGAPWI